MIEKLPPRPKILLIKLRSIGDVIYNTAVYTPLKRRLPRFPFDGAGGETFLRSGAGTTRM